MKLPRLSVNWSTQPELFRRYWDQVLNYLEKTANSVINLFGGPGILFDSNTGEIELDPVSTRNVDHTTVTFTAGSGLTGGGDISASRTFNIGSGTGIVVNADNITVSPVLAAYHGGNTPSSFVLGIVNSANASDFRSGIGAGTVNSVAAGNGMSFTSITGTGSVTLGTPSSVTLASTNSVTSSSHTHAFTPGGTIAQYIRGDGSTATFPTLGTIASQNSNSVSITGGSISGIDGLAISQTTDNISFTYYGDTAVFGGNIAGRHAGGTPSVPTQALSGFVLAGLYGYGYRSTGVWSNAVGAARILATEDFSGTANGTKHEIQVTANGATSRTTRHTVDQNGDIFGTAGSLSMTGGFVWVPSGAGAPTGTPTTRTGLAPLFVDTTNSRLYVRVGTTWKFAALT